MTGPKGSRAAGIGLLVVVLAAGCGGGHGRRDDRPAQVKAACERSVQDRLREFRAEFSGEQVNVDSGHGRATVRGSVLAVFRSPGPPGAPTALAGYPFRCSAERRKGGWQVVALTGLPRLPG
ncbi:hypothetical protein [Actinoallomurus rhizosphaericola]|uniref:hypothetical protein n=1 Tax=Actinoallomurus rhizosphaericola TaxID=2952536 RepID=UPI00209363F0|nr:hypothetical protein [Actinoallomurus rhizosphaericola]MCO5997813.1 hypothetical protein [Actinoallomurus rhizosphaericola]